METNVIAFTLEILFSLAVSLFVFALLQPVLRAMLRELCQGESRAAFWDTFTRLMLFIAPLLVVIMLTKSTRQEEIVLVQAMRDTLLHTLFGQFLGLLIIGKVLLSFSRHNKYASDTACGKSLETRTTQEAR